jgi:hypothetical protein
MQVRDRRWRLRGPFGDVDIEVGWGTTDRKTRDESLRELQWLLYDFRYGSREVRRIVSEVHAALTGIPSAGESLDFGSPRGEAIRNDLHWAAQSGQLVVLKREVRSVVVPLEEDPESVLGPDPAGEEEEVATSWLGLLLVDQDGTPVPGRAYRIVTPSGETIDGQLDSHGSAIVKGLTPGSCRVYCPFVEPHPAVTHTVASGEHLSGIATTYGFDDASVVWARPENSQLKNLRADPHVLQPGDEVFVPEVPDAPASKPTGAKHQFKIKSSPLKLRLKLLGLTGQGISSSSVTLGAGEQPVGGDGSVEAPVAKDAQQVSLSGGAAQTLSLGALNPSDDETDAGWRARLANLGFLWDPTAEDDDDESVIALQDFQAEYGLTVNGQLDDTTKSKIVEVYGC